MHHSPPNPPPAPVKYVELVLGFEIRRSSIVLYAAEKDARLSTCRHDHHHSTIAREGVTRKGSVSVCRETIYDRKKEPSLKMEQTCGENRPTQKACNNSQLVFHNKLSNGLNCQEICVILKKQSAIEKKTLFSIKPQRVGRGEPIEQKGCAVKHHKGALTALTKTFLKMIHSCM